MTEVNGLRYHWANDPRVPLARSSVEAEHQGWEARLPGEPARESEITVGPNQDVGGSSLAIEVDQDGMTLSVQGDVILERTTNLGRWMALVVTETSSVPREASVCLPSRRVIAGQRLKVSLWPEGGGSWPVCQIFGIFNAPRPYRVANGAQITVK